MRTPSGQIWNGLEEVDYVGLDTPKKGVWGGTPRVGGEVQSIANCQPLWVKMDPLRWPPGGGGGGTHTPKSEINNSVSFLNPKKQ